MNVNQLQDRLMQAARTAPADDRVPYRFEQRVMARLQEAARVDAWELWGVALWRGALSCLAVMALAGTLWMQFGPAEPSDCSEAMEDTVYAALNDQMDGSW